MKIAVAQTNPIKGDITANIKKHIDLINLAALNAVELIVFPELSIIGYEPSIAKDTTISMDDPRLNPIQTLSNNNNMVIAVGVATLQLEGIGISLILFSPHAARQCYTKKHLYGHENDYFVPGKIEVYLNHNQSKIAPAICFEISVMSHALKAHKEKANIYMSSVAKTKQDIEKTDKRMPKIAEDFGMTVMMSNFVGSSDRYQWIGYSSIWDHKGILKGRMNSRNEGVLIYDLLTRTSDIKMI